MRYAFLMVVAASLDRRSVLSVALLAGLALSASAYAEVEPPKPDPASGIVIVPPAAASLRSRPTTDQLQVLVYAFAGMGSGKRIYDTLPLQQACDPKRPHLEYGNGRVGAALGVRWTLKETMEAQIRGTVSTFGLAEAFQELCNSREPAYSVDVSALQVEVEGTMRLRPEELAVYLGAGPRIGYILGRGRAVSATREVDAGFTQPIAGLVTEIGYLFGDRRQLDLGIRFGFLWAGEVTPLDLVLNVGYAVW